MKSKKKSNPEIIFSDKGRKLTLFVVVDMKDSIARNISI